MVTISNETINISLNSNLPVSTLESFQIALITAIQHYNSEGDDGTTIYFLGEILQALLPTFEQSKFMHGTQEPAKQE